MKHVVLFCYLIAVCFCAFFWAEEDRLRGQYEPAPLAGPARAAVEKITYLDRAKNLLGLMMDSFLQLEKSMRDVIQLHKRVDVVLLLLTLPGAVWAFVPIRKKLNPTPEPSVPSSPGSP